jgi:hypothetical protein
MIAVAESILTQCQCMGCDSEGIYPKQDSARKRTHPQRGFAVRVKLFKRVPSRGVGSSGSREGPLGE